jgi:hypothetical protein
METKLAAVLWSLNDLGSEQLPQIASAWLEKGLSSPSMLILAGESQTIMSEVGPIFERMLMELDIEIPSHTDAAILLSKNIAQEIVDGRKSPYTGAREIWMLSIDYPTIIPTEFTGLASEHEDFRDDYHQKYYGEEHCKQVVREIEERIINEANKFLAE